MSSAKFMSVVIILFIAGCVGAPPPTPETTAPTPTTPPVALTDLSHYSKKSFSNINYERLKGRTIWSSGYFEGGAIDFYTKSGFKGMAWADNPGSPQGVEFAAGRSNALKAIGWFYAAAFGLSGPDNQEAIDYATKNYLKDEDILIDLDGNKVKRPFFWEKQTVFPYFYSIFSDNYKRYLKDMPKNLTDNGVYGIVFDDSLYISVGGPPGSVTAPGNSNIIDAFKAHLRSKYDSAYLKTKFGIDNIDSFDFKSYFKSKSKETSNPDPLLSEYILFLHEKVENTLRELKDYANQEAGKKGRKFVISGNSPVLHPHWFRFFDTFDYYVGEFFLYSGDPQRASIASKVLESLGDKQFLYYTEIETAGLNIPEKVNALAKEQLADIYSHPNGAFIPFANNIKTLKDGIFLGTPATFDWEITGNFGKFMDKNDFLFNGLKSYADVGVVYSLPSMLGGHGYSVHVESKTSQNDKSFWGTLMLLQDMGVQYRVIFTGDDRVYPKKTKLDLTELKQYKTMILPQIFSISDENVDIILKYVEEGGTAIAISSFATHDEKGAVKQRSKISSLVSEGEHNYGKGKFVFLSENHGEKYYGAARDSNKFFGPRSIVDSFDSKVNKYIFKILRTKLSAGLVPLAYSAPNGDVIFLVNYNVDPEKQKFSGVTSATVSLQKENVQVYFFDPNKEKPVLIKDGDPLSFEYLGILFYTPKEWARSKWKEIEDQVTKTNNDKAREALQLAKQENYLGAYILGNEAIKFRKKVLYDEAHNSAYSLTWEGATKRNPQDPFGRAMRTYRGFLEEKFDLHIKTAGQLSLEELSRYDLVIIDTPESFSPSEREALDQYIGKGGRVLLFNGYGPCTQSVNDFLSKYGMSVECAGNIKKTKDYIKWYNNFMAYNFTLFDLPPTFISNSRALRVNPPSIAIGFTDRDVYIDKNYNNAMDPNEEKGPFAILGAYKSKSSSGMLLVYSDHSQQDWVIDAAGTLGIHLALLDLALNG